MKSPFGEAKDNVPIINEPTVGHFAPDVEAPKPLIWEKCREQFAVKFLPTIDGFYYCHGDNMAEPVAGFMSKVEEVLDLVDEPTTFHRTVRKSVIYMRPSVFWKQCEMRRSLLTILIRCGSKYDPDKDNFEYALLGGDDTTDPQEYVRVTKLAIMRFFFGFTKFVPHSGYQRLGYSDTIHRMGWVEVFKGKDLDFVRQTLVLPPGKELSCNPVGLHSIWT